VNVRLSASDCVAGLSPTSVCGVATAIDRARATVTHCVLQAAEQHVLCLRVSCHPQRNTVFVSAPTEPDGMLHAPLQLVLQIVLVIGIAMCVFGALMLAVAVLLARRLRRGRVWRKPRRPNRWDHTAARSARQRSADHLSRPCAFGETVPEHSVRRARSLRSSSMIAMQIVQYGCVMSPRTSWTRLSRKGSLRLTTPLVCILCCHEPALTTPVGVTHVQY